MIDKLSEVLKANQRRTVVIGVLIVCYLGLAVTSAWISMTVPTRRYEPVFDRPVSYVPGGRGCQLSSLDKLPADTREKKQDECDQAILNAYHSEVQTVTALREADNSDIQTKSALLQTIILFFTLVPTAIGTLIGALPYARRPRKNTLSRDA